MNNLSLLNTISYCILILYAYKDFPSHFISFIYIPWVAFGLVVLGAALQHTWSFLINLINGICNLILGVARLSGSRLVKIGFLETWCRGLALCYVLATLHKDRTSVERQPGTTAQPQDWNGTVLAY